MTPHKGNLVDRGRSQIEAMQAGIDWLSISMPVACHSLPQWIRNGQKVIEGICDEGHKIEYRRLLGYEGVSAANCFVGANEQGGYMQFCGAYADSAFDRVYDPICKVSRLDLQVSTKFDVMPTNIAKEAYRDAIRANENLPNGRKRKVWIIVGSDGGDTTYIGAPSSEQRGRIYNKEVQSELVAYARTWRYEVVFRNDISTSIARYIASYTLKRTDWVISCVIDWYNKRGVAFDWFFDRLDIAVPLERTKPTDVERKMEWLRTQVNPTVRYLLTVCDRDDILLALGLS